MVTVELPLAPVTWDVVDVDGNHEETEPPVEEEKGEEEKAADADSTRPAAEAAEQSRDEEGDGKESKAESASTAEEGDALAAGPAGLLPRPDGSFMRMLDGRPIGTTSLGPVTPTGGWRVTDINGHQPVTASDHAFVTGMLARRERLVGGGR